jgi:hypothetical protein
MKPFFRTTLLFGIATLVLAEAQEAYAQEQSAGQHHSTFAAKLEEIMRRPEFIHSEFGIALYVNRVPTRHDAPGGPALWVGQVVGEIAAAAYSF